MAGSRTSPNQDTAIAEVLLEIVIGKHGESLLYTFHRSRAKFCVERTHGTSRYQKDQNYIAPQSGGMVEKHNQTINNYLLCAAENKRDWDNLVPLFQIFYRSSYHEATYYTSAMLLTGREMWLPINLTFGKPPAKAESSSNIPVYER